MSAYRKQLPTSMRVQMTEADRSLPKRLTIRTGKAESTKISVQIMDGSKKVWHMRSRKAVVAAIPPRVLQGYHRIMTINVEDTML